MTEPVPTRLERVAAAIEQGNPVDWDRVLQLQAIDVAIANERFVRENAELRRKADLNVAKCLDLDLAKQTPATDATD